LLARRSASLRFLVRKGSKPPANIAAEVVSGSYDDDEALGRAMAGIDVAFVVSASASPGMRAELHARAFRTAKRAGARHVVYLSLQGRSPESPYPFARDHWQSEESLRASGIPHTILRNGKYTEQLLAAELRGSDGVIHGPTQGGAIAWISRRDSARVIASVLESPPGGVVSYTGPEAVSVQHAVARLARALGAPLHFVGEPSEVARARVLAKAEARWQGDLAEGTYRAISAGEYSQLHDASRWLTGDHGVERLEDTARRGALDELWRAS